MDWKLKVLLGIGVAYVGTAVLMGFKNKNRCLKMLSTWKPPATENDLMRCKFKVELNPLKWL